MAKKAKNENNVIKELGLLIYGHDKFVNQMAQDLGLSRNYLDKLLSSNAAEKKDALQLIGLADVKAAELEQRAERVRLLKRELAALADG